VADAGVRSLAKCEELRELNLFGTKVTDVGAIELARLGRLEVLDLRNTRVSRECLSRLRDALPKCCVRR
jgi:hypothetical protein